MPAATRESVGAGGASPVTAANVCSTICSRASAEEGGGGAAAVVAAAAAGGAAAAAAVTSATRAVEGAAREEEKDAQLVTGKAPTLDGVEDGRRHQNLHRCYPVLWVEVLHTLRAPEADEAGRLRCHRLRVAPSPS